MCDISIKGIKGNTNYLTLIKDNSGERRGRKLFTVWKKNISAYVSQIFFSGGFPSYLYIPIHLKCFIYFSLKMS